MAENVDRRIMEMRFENRQFERNIAKSKKSVEELKEAMDFDETSKGMEKFAKGMDAIDFSKMESNIQKLTDKFTGLGKFSELVISQIRRGIEDVARKFSGFITSMTTQQVNAGMTKYNELNKSVQTIKAATGEDEKTVYQVLERLNKYTDQTSYNFADMASNIGKFTSVGIDLKSAEKQMEGIANWAARSGAGMEEASRAMYNLSQAMGVGKLTKIDWKSIENAGMATKEFKEQLIQAGVEMGTLVESIDKKSGQTVYKTSQKLGKQVEVNFSNMAETLSKGWASSAVLSSTLERYYWDDLYYEGENVLDALGDEQKKTLEKMLDDGDISIDDWKGLNNLKEISDEAKQSILDLAVSSKKLTETTDKDGNKLYEFTNAAGEKIQFSMEQFEESLSSGWFDKDFGKKVLTASKGVNELAKSSYEAAQKCKSFSEVLDAWRDQISTGWMNSFKLIFGELSESMEFFSAVCDKVGTAIGELIDIRNGILEAWAGSGGRQDLFSIIVGDFEEGAEGNAFGLLDIFTSIKDLLRDGMIDMFSIFMSPDDATKSKADPRYFATWMGRKLAEITKKVKDFVGSIRGFFNEGITVNGQVTTRLDMIRNVVKGVAGAIAMAYNIGKNVFGFFRTIVSQLMPSLDAVMGFFSKLGITIFDSSKKANKSNALQKFFSDLAEILKPITNIINIAVASVADLFSAIFGLDKKEGDQGSKVFTNIGEGIKKLADIISKYLTPVIGFFADFIRIIRDIVSNKFSAESLAQFGTKFKAIFDKLIASMPEPIKNFVATIEKFFSGEKFQKIRDKVQKAFEGIVNAIPKDLKGKLGKVIKKIRKFFEDMKSGVANAIKKLFQKGDPQITEATEAVSNSIIPSDLTDMLNRGTAGDSKPIFQRALDWIKNKFDAVKQFFANVHEYLTGGANSFSSKVGEFVNWLKAVNWNDILGIAVIAGAAATVAYLSITFIQSFKKLAAGIQTIGECLKKGVHFKASLVQIGEDDDDEEEEAAETMGDKILKIALAVAIISAAIMLIGRMQWQDAVKGLAVVGIIIAAIIACVLIFRSAFNGNEKKGKEGLGEEGAEAMANVFKAIAISIAIIIASLLVLTKLKDPMDFVKMAGGLIVILGALTAVMLVMSKNKLSMNKTGMLEFIALAFSIKILIGALLPLAVMRWDMMAKMAAGLVVMLGSLVLVMAAVNKMSVGLKGSGMAQLIAMALSIAILVAVLLPLSFLPEKQLIKLAAILAVALGEIIIAMVFVNSMSRGLHKSGMAQLIAMALSIAILLAALLPIALLPNKQLLKMGIVLEVLLLMLVGVMKQVSKKGASIKGAGMAQLIGFALAIGILALALLPIATLNNEQVARILAVAIGLMLGLTAVMFVISKGAMKASGAVASLIVIIGIVGVIVALTFALNEIKDISTEKILSFTTGITLLVVGIGGISALLGSLGIAGALTGIVAFFILLAGTMAIVAALLPWVINSILPAIANIGPVLTELGAAFKVFGESLGGIDAENFRTAVDMIKAVAELQQVLTSNNIKLSVLKAFGVDVEPADIKSFGKNMEALGDSLAHMSKKLKNFKANKMDRAIACIKAFAELKNGLDKIAITKAAIEWITGKDIMPDPNEFSTFVASMLELSEPLAKFVNGTGGLEFNSNVDSAINLIKTFADLYSGLSNISIEEAVARWILPKDKLPDPQDFATFAKKMTRLAQPLADFVNKTNGLVFNENVESAINCIKTFASLYNGLFDISILNGIALWIVPSDKLPNADELIYFVNAMAQMGGPLSEFVGATSGLVFNDNVKNSIDCIKTFDSLYNGLFDVSIADAVALWIIPADKMPNANDFIEFSKKLAKMGGPLSRFVNATSKIKFNTNTKNAVDCITTFAGLYNGLRYVSFGEAVARWILPADKLPNTNDFITFANAMADMGGPLSNFISKTFKLTFNESTENSIACIKTFADVYRDLQHVDFGEAITKLLLPSLTEPDVKSFSDFVGSMGAVAEPLSTFVSTTSGLEFTESVDKAINCIAAFAAIQKLLKQDEIKTALASALLKPFGVDVTPKDLKDFGDTLVPLGEGMAGFTKAVSIIKDEEGNLVEINTEKMDVAIRAIQAFAELQTAMPNVDGLFQWFTGHKSDLETFGSLLGGFGDDVKSFFTNVLSGGVVTVENAKAIGPVISALADISYEARLEHAPENLTSTLDTMGTSINDLFKKIAKVEPDALKAVTAIATIMDVAKKMYYPRDYIETSIEEIEELFEETYTINSLKRIGKKFDELIGDGINEGTGYIAEKLTPLIETASAKLTEKIDLHPLGKEFAYFLEIFNMYSDVLPYISEIVSGIAKLSMVTDGMTITLNESLAEALTNVIDNKALALALDLAGHHIATGIGDGIKKGTDYVTDKIKDLVQAAIDKYNAETKTSSPSRVFMDLAEYIPAGIGEGITNGAPEALEPITKLVDLITGTFTDAAKSNAFRNFVNTIDQLLYGTGDGVDTEKLGVTLRLLEAIEQVMASTDGLNPTITPVLDMTNVQNGMDLFRQDLHNNPFGMPVGGPTYGPNQNGSSGIIPPETAMAMLAEARELYTGQVNRQTPATSTYATSAELADFRKSLEAMNNTLNDFGEKFDNLAIVLNTGALVGGIAPEMERELGRRGFYSSRRN